MNLEAFGDEGTVGTCPHCGKEPIDCACSLCAVCGEPMPEGEEMFKFHGYSGECPKPPLPQAPSEIERLRAALDLCRRHVFVRKFPKDEAVWLAVRDALGITDEEMISFDPLPSPTCADKG